MNQLYQLLFWCFIALFSFNSLYAESNPIEELSEAANQKETSNNSLKGSEVFSGLPILTSPAYFSAYEPTTSQVELSWNVLDPTDISNFIVEYTINNIVQPQITSLSASATSHILPELTSGSRISWRVASVNSLDEEVWSDWSLFFVKRDRKVYVKSDGIGSGSSWNDAVALRTALRNYVYGDTLWMAKGVYTPTSSSDRTFRFDIEEGIHIYGGFVGFETLLSQRDWQKNPTVLSGNIGDSNSKTDNSYNVLSFDGRTVPITNLTRLDGLIIEGGYASLSAGNNNQGGAFQLRNASPLIVNVHFRNNCALSYGGAVYANASSEAKFYNCLFEKNSASTWGGAVATDGNVSFTNCVFYGNQAIGRGGAISGPQIPKQINIYNSILWSNEAPTGDQVFGQLNILYSIVEGYEAPNISNANPLFVNPSNGDFRINQNSPALNRGKNSYLPEWLTMDFSNSSRIIGQAVDLGIYEGITRVPEAISPENMEIIDFQSSSVQIQWSWTPTETFIGYTLEYQVNDGTVISTDTGVNSLFSFTDINPASEVRWRVGAKNSDQGLVLWSAWSNFIVNRDKPLFVKSGATGNGSSWQDAMSLHNAIKVAVYGDEVWIAAGTYKPTTTTDRNIAFNLSEGIKLYGGFSGMETSLDQRNFLNNPSIFSGNIGAAGVEADNSYNVFRIVGTAQNPITNATVIDGVYIQDGYASISTGDRADGGGMYLSNASPIISNVWFRFNYAKGNGGAVCSDETSRPQFANVIFSDNTALTSGGGVYTNSKVEFYNCVWYKNSSRFGGAISSSVSTSIAYNSIFWSNSATVSKNDLDYAKARYCLVQDGSGTDHIITANPELEDPSNGDFSFKNSSPAMDAGSKDFVPIWLTKDFYGNPRISGKSVDLGIFEFEQGSSVINNYSELSSALEIWPNPVLSGSEVYARLSFQHQKGVLSLSDFSGSILKQWNLSQPGIINLGNLNIASGLYLVTFKNYAGQQTISAKLVVK